MLTHLPDPQTQPEFYENVPFKRLLAWVVDTVLILVVCLLVSVLTVFVTLLIFPALMLLVGFVYRVVTIANGSATWGMRLMAIELRRHDGARFELGMALAHTLGYTLSWTVPVFQLISMILMVTTERGQGLTDHVLGTTAINRTATY